MVGIIAVGISAAKLLPTLEFAKYSIRSGAPLYGMGNPLNADWELKTLKSLMEYLITPLIPNPIGIIKSLFSNIPFIFFILISFFYKKKEALFFSIITIISLLALMGKNFPIDFYSFFYCLIPGMKTFDQPLRFVIILNLSFAALASLGVSYIWNISSNKGRFALIVVCFIAILYPITFNKHQIKAFFYNDNVKSYELEHKGENFNSEISKLISKEKDIVRVASNYYVLFKDVYDYSALKYNFRLVNPNFALTYQFYPLSTAIVNPDFSKKNFSLTKNDDFLYKKYKLLGLSNTKYIVSENKFDDYPNKYIDPVFKGSDGSIYKLKTYLPFVSNPAIKILFIDNDNFHDFNAFKAKMFLLNREFDIKTTSILTTNKHLADISGKELQGFEAIIINSKLNSGKDEIEKINKYINNGGDVIYIQLIERYYPDVRARSYSILSDKPAIDLDGTNESKFMSLLNKVSIEYKHVRNDIAIIKNTPEFLEFKIKTHEDNQLFRVADTYYPGWKAYDNNQEIPIYMADGLVKGFILKKQGVHNVRLSFQPLSFKVGLAASILTIILSIGYFYKVLNKFHTTRKFRSLATIK